MAELGVKPGKTGTHWVTIKGKPVLIGESRRTRLYRLVRNLFAPVPARRKGAKR